MREKSEFSYQASETTELDPDHVFNMQLDDRAFLPPDDPANLRLQEVFPNSRAIVEVSISEQHFTAAELSPEEAASSESGERHRSYIWAHVEPNGALTWEEAPLEARQTLGESVDPGGDEEFEDYCVVATITGEGMTLENLYAESEGIMVRHSSTASVHLSEYMPAEDDSLDAQYARAREAGVGRPVNADDLDLNQKTELWGDYNLRLVEHPALQPVSEVHVGDRNFKIGKIITGVRQMAVMFTNVMTSTGPMTACRLVYKSQSDGGWRASPGFFEGDFLKSAHADGTYTQEMKLVPELVDALEREESDALYADGDTNSLQTLVFDYFVDPEIMAENTAPVEVEYFREPEVDEGLAHARLVPTGFLNEGNLEVLRQEYGYESYSEYARSLDDEVFAKLPGFVPDFTASPQSRRQSEHTLLGAITLETYPAVCVGRDVIWVMAYDAEGRVWVDDVRLAEAHVTSYGTYSPVLDVSAIVQKPLDYDNQEQTSGINSRERRSFDKHPTYVDITFFSDELLPVRNFRDAKTIVRGGE